MRKINYKTNEIIKFGDYSEMILYSRYGTQIAKTIIDTDDIPNVINHRWFLCGNGYVQAMIGKHCYLHRFILGKDNPQKIDHINRNKLDNRKSNLRFCSDIENAMNKAARSSGTSRYKGVSWSIVGNSWMVQIQRNNITYNVGYFKNEEDAARAYDTKARELFGEFAYLNFKEDTNG